MGEIREQEQVKQTIIIQQRSSNGVGIAGFVLSLIAFLGLVPALGWFLWALGLIFSICGMFSAPRGFAIAGLVISLLGLTLLLLGLTLLFLVFSVFVWLNQI